MTCDLKGRNALITGANQGFGLAVARAFIKAGANVMLCARNGAMLESARAELAKEADPSRIIRAETADVGSRPDVERLVKNALGTFGRLDAVVNNAGVYGPKGAIEDVDWDEWVDAIRINLLGSVMVTRAVLPHMKGNKYGKIIQLSGGGATNPLPRISAYAASKAAVVRFVETVAEEAREFRVDINAIAPGALNTRMLAEVLEAGPGKVGRAFYDRAVKQKEAGGTAPELGADLAVFLASAASDGITGKLISAVWDPWETLPDRVKELNSTDVYALRRIVPKDRGMDWGDK